MEQISVTRHIPVKYTADICVVGAGPAGVAAAVTAARRGGHVLLIDGMAMPGGMSTAALVPVFMSCTDGVNFLPAGFGREVIDRLQALAARRNFDSGLAINAEHLKRVYDDLLAESNVEPLYYTRLVDAVVESGRIEAILCNAPSGNFAVKAPIYLDATGDGTLAVLAGAPYEFGGENGEPDTLVSDVYFRSLENGNNLEPIYSQHTVRSHSLTNVTADSLTARAVWLFDYQITINYNADCSQATVHYVDNYADTPDEERQVSDYVVKASLTSTEDRTYDKLQKNYSVFDAAQLYFMARGITFGEDTTQTVTTVSEAGKNTVTLTCTELSSLSRTFALDGQAADTNSSFAVAKVKFSIQNGDIYTGQSRTVTYAQKTSGSENTLYNLPVQIEEPLAYNMGSYVYSLKSATHTR